MTMNARSLFCLGLVAGLAACASKNPSDPGKGETCNDLQRMAGNAVSAAAGSVPQCVTNADCKPADHVGFDCVDCLHPIGGPLWPRSLWGLRFGLHRRMHIQGMRIRVRTESELWNCEVRWKSL